MGTPDPGPCRPESGPTGWTYPICVGLLSALALACIWVPAWPPGTDIPSHVYFAAVLSDPARWSGLVEVNVPLTSQLFVWMTAALSWLGLNVATKLALTVVAAGTVTGFWAIGRELGDRRPAGVLIGLAATQTFYSAMGFANFSVAVACGLFAVAQALRAFRVRAPLAWVVLGGWLMLTAYAHVIVAGMFGVHVALLALLHPGAGGRIRRLRATVLAGVPAAAYVLVVASVARSGYIDGGISEGLSIQRLPWLEQLRGVGELCFGGFSQLGPLVTAAVFVGLAQRVVRGPARGAGRAAALVAALWLLLYLLVPFHGWGWAYAQPRVLVVAVLVAGAWAGWGGTPRVTLWATAAVVGAYLASTLIGLAPWGDRVAAEVAGQGETSPGRAMEVVIDPGQVRTSRHVTPLLHVAKYALIRGGVSQSLPSFSRAIHSVRGVAFPDGAPPAPPLFVSRALDCAVNPACERAAEVLRQRIVAQGLSYDSVLLTGADASYGEALSACGYARRSAGHFVGRPADVLLETTPPPAAAEAPLLVRAGWPDGFGWIAGSWRPPGPVDGPESIPVGALPSCPLVLEVVLGARRGGVGVGERVLLRDRIVVPAGREAVLRSALPAEP